ncbi:MAG: SxtJ family membrane protein, partial [Bacteroidota bacterium]
HTAWQWLVGASGFFLVTGLFIHPILRPIYIGWMKFAFVLGWINTRILLGVFFYLIITPTGLLMRLFGKDFLSEKLNKNVRTYWIKREPTELDPKRYENLF